MDIPRSLEMIDVSIDGRVAEMIADVRLKMQALGLTDQEIADRCGCDLSRVAAYLNDTEELGITDLTKLATAVGCVWRLQPSVTNSQSRPPS